MRIPGSVRASGGGEGTNMGKGPFGGQKEVVELLGVNGYKVEQLD